MSSKNVEKKLTNTKMEIPAKEQSKEVSEVVKTMRKRREDMAGTDEKKLKEEKERSAIENILAVIMEVKYILHYLAQYSGTVTLLLQPLSLVPAY